MMMVPNIFGGAKPMFSMAEPKFGGARLPNNQEANNGGQGLERNLTLLGQLTRRAVGTKVRQLLYLNCFAQFGSLQTWYTLSQRLGVFMGFDQMQRQHSSKTSGKLGGRSGASPHQKRFDQMQRRHPSRTSGKSGSRSEASPLQCTLMTKIKTFVPYFIYPVVSL